MDVLAICGSLRERSSNGALLEALPALAPEGMRISLYRELGDLPHFNPDRDGEGQEPPAAVARLRALVTASQGFIISSPEYAHGVPGALKNALDWLVSYPDFAGKPVLLVNASAAGGDHAQASLAETLRTMAARVLPESLLTPFLRKKLAPGEPLPAEAARALSAALTALLASVPPK